MAQVREVLSRSEDETLDFASRIGRLIKPGTVVALTGPLGAGKTVFMKGLASSMGVDSSTVLSPTFTYVRKYRSTSGYDVYHVDLFRVRDTEELMLLGLDELMTDRNVVVIEWAERAGRFLPGNRISVHLEWEGEGRRIRITGLEGI